MGDEVGRGEGEIPEREPDKREPLFPSNRGKWRALLLPGVPLALNLFCALAFVADSDLRQQFAIRFCLGAVGILSALLVGRPLYRCLLTDYERKWLAKPPRLPRGAFLAGSATVSIVSLCIFIYAYDPLALLPGLYDTRVLLVMLLICILSSTVICASVLCYFVPPQGRSRPGKGEA